jgi:hypothetical protein
MQNAEQLCCCCSEFRVQQQADGRSADRQADQELPPVARAAFLFDRGNSCLRAIGLNRHGRAYVRNHFHLKIWLNQP